MVIKTLDDIEREQREREKRKFKEDVLKDTKFILGKILKPPIKGKKKKTWLLKILIWFGALFLTLFIVNLILGNIWLLKTLIKNLFFGG